jgi:hypothetical protein
MSQYFQIEVNLNKISKAIQPHISDEDSMILFTELSSANVEFYKTLIVDFHIRKYQKGINWDKYILKALINQGFSARMAHLLSCCFYDSIWFAPPGQ